MSTRIILVLITFIVTHPLLAQEEEAGSMVRVTGTVTGSEPDTPLKAHIYYEKLPYYDDIGVSNTNQANGVYELHLIQNEKYSITIKSDGYKPIVEEFEVIDQGLGLIEKNFIMKPDALHEKITLDNLIFARSRAVITQQSYSELDEFADWLDKRPNAIVQLEGHTDFQGNADANMALSEDRVSAVKDYLVSKGIKKSRIKTKAFGGTQPLTRDRTPEGRAKNRRVEVRIIQQ